MGLDTEKELLKQLLDYVAHMIRLPERSRFSVREGGGMLLLQEQLTQLCPKLGICLSELPSNGVHLRRCSLRECFE